LAALLDLHEPLCDPVLCGFDVAEAGMRWPVKPAKPGLKEPLSSHVLVLVGEPHNQRNKLAPGKYQAAFLIRSARLNAHILKGQDHAASWG
jgi:hypothetical protein